MDVAVSGPAKQTYCARGHELTEDNLYLHRTVRGRVDRRCAMCSRRTQARHRASRPRPVTEQQGRRIVGVRCGGRCERCGGAGPLTVHHRRKRSQGGSWSPSNLFVLCGDGVQKCHGWVEAHPQAAHAAGLWLFHGEDPATTPVLLADEQRVLLAADGTYLPAPE